MTKKIRKFCQIIKAGKLEFKKNTGNSGDKSQKFGKTHQTLKIEGKMEIFIF
jgi:hypothetical protein